MNENSVPSTPAEQDENRLITFTPPEKCHYCDRWTNTALLDLAFHPLFQPVCPLHGYAPPYGVEQTPREVSDERYSIERFVLWMHSERGKITGVSAMEDLSAVPDYELYPGDMAWHCRYEAPGGERIDSYVVYAVDDWCFILYENGAQVTTRESENVE
jgi:hypothetical protein